MSRLTKENYQEDLFELQKTRKVKVGEYIEIGYSQANYNDDLWNKVKAIEDFERFLLWALPRYREEVLEMTSKKALEEIKDFIIKNQTDIRILDLLSLIEKDLEILEILKQKLTINENYNEQCSGSTKAIVLCIPDCVSIDEDDEYTDDCCPNPEYDKIEEWLRNE